MLPIRKVGIGLLVALTLGSTLPVISQTALSLEDAKLLANNGNADAQLALGQAYQNGQGVAQDFTAAAEWYRKADKSGSVDAKVRLAGLMAEGLGVDRDLEAAFTLFEAAANTGHPDATLILGTMYEKGLGTEASPRTAAALYETAAKLGMAEAATNLAVLYQEGEQISQDFALARLWYERGAQMGSVRAVNNLGVMHLRGEGMEKNPEQAAKLFQIAVDNGSTEAMSNLASLYESALGVPLNEELSKELYRRAAQGMRNKRTSAGLPDAQGILDILNAEGFDRKALKRAAESGDVQAQYVLGHLHMNGWGTPQDYVTAYAWLNLATAETGETDVRDTLAERMTSSQINAGQALSRDLMETIAAGG